MTLMHVLGGLSLLILVAVASMVRAGLGVEHADGPSAGEQEAVAEVDAAEVVETALEPVTALGPVHFGPLLDRMRP